ncbi:MAG: exodeoxyribonuclease VII small subunit [Acidimicrobiales bacterium]
MTEPTTTTVPAPEPPGSDAPISGYAAALTELDAILSELEDPDLDVDRLAPQLRRASALIAFCRQRITGARLEIEAITQDDEAV